MKTIFRATILGAGLLLPTVANADQCGPKQMVAQQLVDRYGEITFASGVSTDKSVKFFGNPRTGTWSMVIIKPDGTACVVAIGDGLEVIKLAFAQEASH